MLIEEIKSIPTTKKDLQKFGSTVGLVFLAIALILFFKGRFSYIYFATVWFLLTVPALVFPRVLKFPYKAWMALAFALGFISTRVILSLLFYVVITPISAIAKLSGKDFLDQKFDKSKTSYWNYREKKEYKPQDSEAQF